MVQILVIEKCGNINNNKIQSIDDLYKKCGFRKSDDFEMINVWKYGDSINIELWGRVVGKENNKNLYNFISSIDRSIYGNCSLVAKDNNNYIDLTHEMWNEFTTNNKVEKINTTINKLEDSVENLKNLSINTKNKIDKKDNTCEVSETSSVLDVSDIDETESSSSDNLLDNELKHETYIYSSEEENDN